MHTKHCSRVKRHTRRTKGRRTVEEVGRILFFCGVFVALLALAPYAAVVVR